MPEHIRALIIILILSTTVFVFAKSPASDIVQRSDFARRRNFWIALTLAAFLAHDIWVYFLVAGTLMFGARAHESNPVALFFFLLFVVPGFQSAIPGMGLVNYLFNLSHQRLLTLVILLPVFFTLVGQKQTLPFGRTITEKLLAAYIILIIILYMRDASITETLRKTIYQFIDIFLPFYVISRSLKNKQDFQEALLFFVIATMVLALIGSFESVKHWLLYNSLGDVLGIPKQFNVYEARAGLQRATASVGTIPMGYLMTVGIGFFLYLQRCLRFKFYRRTGFMLLLVGLLAPLSRGPWVGAIFLILVFGITGQRPFQSVGKYIVLGLLALSLIAIFPATEKIIDLLPYIGKEEMQFNITYREKLIENSLVVINRHPFFGSTNYLDNPEMEAMVQGQGIIDVVNTYLGIALERGYVGVSLFLGFFTTICWGIYRSFRRLSDSNSDELLLGRSLLSTIASILIIITTVSSVSIIPIVFWSVAGLGVAYINMMERLQINQIKNENHGT